MDLRPKDAVPQNFLRDGILFTARDFSLNGLHQGAIEERHNLGAGAGAAGHKSAGGNALSYIVGDGPVHSVSIVGGWHSPDEVRG